jgi:hypothetical protein
MQAPVECELMNLARIEGWNGLEIANEDPDNLDPLGSNMFYTSLTQAGDLWSFGPIRAQPSRQYDREDGPAARDTISRRYRGHVTRQDQRRARCRGFSADPPRVVVPDGRLFRSACFRRKLRYGCSTCISAARQILAGRTASSITGPLVCERRTASPTSHCQGSTSTRRRHWNKSARHGFKGD